MKVISTYPDGNALVEFDNLVQQTDVVGGVTAPIQAVVAISSIPDLICISQKARRSAQKMSSIFAIMKKNEIS